MIKRFTVKKYISELENFDEIIENALKQRIKLLNIIAPAGGGKTFASLRIMTIANRYFGNCRNMMSIFGAPRKDIAIQTFNTALDELVKYKEECALVEQGAKDGFFASTPTIVNSKDFGYTDEETPLYIVVGKERHYASKDTSLTKQPLTISNSDLSNGNFIATYEKILSFIEDNPNRKFILIVDECHTLTSERSFRESLRKFVELINTNSNLLLLVTLTASPVPTVYNGLINIAKNDSERLDLYFNIENSNIKNIYPVAICDTKGELVPQRKTEYLHYLDKIFYTIDHHQSKGYKGQILIHLDHSFKLNFYKEAIKEVYGFKSVVFSSEMDETNEDLKLLLKYSTIDSKYKVILCTRKLIAGVNIKSELNTIAFLSTPSDIDLIQFPNRARKQGNGINSSLDILVFENKEVFNRRSFFFTKNITNEFATVKEYSETLYKSGTVLDEFGYSKFIKTNEKGKYIDYLHMSDFCHTNENTATNVIAKARYANSIDKSFILHDTKTVCILNPKSQSFKELEKELKEQHENEFLEIVCNSEKGLIFTFLHGLLLKLKLTPVQVASFVNKGNLAANAAFALANLQNNKSCIYGKNKALKGLSIDHFKSLYLDSLEYINGICDNLELKPLELVRKYKNLFKNTFKRVETELYYKAYTVEKFDELQDCILSHDFDESTYNINNTAATFAKIEKVQFAKDRPGQRGILAYDIEFIFLKELNTITAKKRANAARKVTKPFYTQTEFEDLLETALAKAKETYSKKTNTPLPVKDVKNLEKDYFNTKLLSCLFDIEIKRERLKKSDKKQTTIYTFKEAKYNDLDHLNSLLRDAASKVFNG